MNKKGMKQSAKLSIDLITTIIVTLIAGAVTVAAVISMAWFASNKEVGTNGSSVTVDAELFELGVVRHAGVSSNVDNKSNYTGAVPDTVTWITVSDNVLNLLSPVPVPSNRPYYYFNNGVEETTASDSSILCDLQIQSKNYDGDTEKTIRPESFGKLVLLIKPKKDGLSFVADISLKGIKDLNDGNPSVLDGTSETNTDENRAYDYLNGHIVFFTDEGRTKLLSNKAINEEGLLYISGATKADEVYVVTVYWEWAQTINRLNTILNSNSIYLGDSENDSVTVISDQNAEKYVFSGTSDDTGYNNADQFIGDHIMYILADVTVQTTDEQVELTDNNSVLAVSQTPQSPENQGGEGGE